MSLGFDALSENPLSALSAASGGITAAKFSAAAGIAGHFASPSVANDITAVSGYNPWQMNEMRRREELAVDDMEIIEIMRAVMPHINHRRVGLRSLSRSSSRGRSPSSAVTH